MTDQPRRVEEAHGYLARSEGAYLDVHAWRFTPPIFERIFETVFRMGETVLRPVAVYDTPRSRLEFIAVLRAEPPGFGG